MLMIEFRPENGTGGRGKREEGRGKKIKISENADDLAQVFALI